MKGVLLAGGSGVRLKPFTCMTNKHVLPVYDKPMIYYSLRTLAKSKVEDIQVVIGGLGSGDVVKTIGEYQDELGISVSFVYQESALGIADALRRTEKFANGDSVAVMLGDMFYEVTFESEIDQFLKDPTKCHLFLKKCEDPRRYAVAELDSQGRVIGLIEKPSDHYSDLAVTGFYLFPPDVYSVISTIKPSKRDEYEITDVTNYYVRAKKCVIHYITGQWYDMGSFDDLLKAAVFVAKF